jgi:hypothetical protein
VCKTSWRRVETSGFDNNSTVKSNNDGTISLKPTPIGQHHNWPHCPLPVALDKPSRKQGHNKATKIVVYLFERSNKVIAVIDWSNATALNPTTATARHIRKPSVSNCG